MSWDYFVHVYHGPLLFAIFDFGCIACFVVNQFISTLFLYAVLNWLIYHLVQGSPNFFVQGPHKLLHNSSRAGHLA